MIELVNHRLSGRRTIAMMDHYGYRFRFSSKRFDLMPDEVAQDVIAHELAHGMQAAEGIRCTREYSDGRADYANEDGEYCGDNLDIEYGADEMIRMWGFDPYSVDEWSLKAGIIKTVSVDDPAEEEALFRKQLERVNRLGR
jgi:hypothetical protein